MTPSAIRELISRSPRVTIVVHIQPDGDVLGSAFALKEALLGREVSIVCASPAPSIYSDVLPGLTTDSRLPDKTDLLIVLDCSEIHRTGFGRQITALSKKIPVVVIDHHKTGDIGKITKSIYSDNQANSTTELVMNIIKELNLAITPNMATALLLGIYSDTGGFQHAFSPAQAYKLASQLIRRGANLGLITKTYLASLPRRQQRLWGMALSRLTVNRFGIAVTRISAQDLVDHKAEEEDLHGLANLIALVSEAKAALVMIENGHGWRGILRTRFHTVNVGRLARLIGGTGSQKAAGFTVTKDLF